MKRREFLRQLSAVPIIGLALSCGKSSGNSDKPMTLQNIDSTAQNETVRIYENSADINIEAPEIFNKIMQFPE